jgi:hypothetical protein
LQIITLGTNLHIVGVVALCWDMWKTQNLAGDGGGEALEFDVVVVVAVACPVVGAELRISTTGSMESRVFLPRAAAPQAGAGSGMKG